MPAGYFFKQGYWVLSDRDARKGSGPEFAIASWQNRQFFRPLTGPRCQKPYLLPKMTRRFG